MFLAIVDNLFDFIVIYYYNQNNSSLPLTLILFYQKGENKSSCARTGRAGQAQHKTYKIFPGSPKQAGKKERGFRGKEFCPPVCPALQDLWVEGGSRQRRDSARRRGGGQSEFCVEILLKKGSYFI